MTCEDCKGTGRITLLTSTVDCDCVTKDTCPSSPSGPHHFTEESEYKNAWYSKESAKKFGCCIYLEIYTMNEIATTEVSRHALPSSEWDDLEFVGVVQKFVIGHKSI